MKDPIDLMAALLGAGSETELVIRLEALAQTRGFDKVLVGLQWTESHGESRFRYASGYPKAWQRIYLERGYMDVDPTIRHCVLHTTPVLWTEALFAEAGCPELLKEAHTYGLGYGISVPTHEGMGLRSMVSLAREHAIDYASAEAVQLTQSAQVIAAVAHRAYRQLVQSDLLDEPSRPLSEQEKCCLRWVAAGKTSWEVSLILQISESTAVFHIKNVMEKLGAKSRAQAIAIAFRMGLLT